MKLVQHIFIVFIVAVIAQSTYAIGSEQKWGFIGEGFHMQFYIDFPFGEPDHTYTFDLPNSFFIDTSEAQQMYVVKSCPSGLNPSDVTNCVDITMNYGRFTVETAFLCDIEAPVFRVSEVNKVTLSLQSKTGVVSHQSGSGKLLFPIHARYEALETKRSFNFLSFVRGDEAYVQRCMNPILHHSSSSSNLKYEDVEMNKEEHCRNIPVGSLSDLPFVYNTLMSLLVLGALLVGISLSL